MTVKIISKTDTKEVIEFSTMSEMNIGKIEATAKGLRTLHIDFINNDEKQGYRITWVKGLDDPNNAPELVAQREQQQTNQLRKEELQNKTDITLSEMQELLRL